MRDDFAKAQQIKERITRFSKQDNRITLKYSIFDVDLKSISARIRVEFPTDR